MILISFCCWSKIVNMVVRSGTGHFFTVSTLIYLCALVFLAQPRLATSTTQCLTVDLVLVQCLTNTSTLLVKCPDNYNLWIRAVAVYKFASGCPSAPAPDASCWHSNATDVVNTTCLHESSCMLTLDAPASPLHCSLSTYPGEYFAVVDYRCEPVIRADPGTTTGQTIYISDPEVKTSALISVANNIFGPGGHLLYSTTDYCSIIIPGNAEATVGVNTFITSPMSTPECQQRLELSQWNANQTYQLCRLTTPFTIDCAADGMDRYFKLRYVNDDVTVGTLFFIHIQVSAWSAVTVQCGTPPVPLLVANTSATEPTTATSMSRVTTTLPTTTTISQTTTTTTTTTTTPTTTTTSPTTTTTTTTSPTTTTTTTISPTATTTTSLDTPTTTTTSPTTTTTTTTSPTTTTTTSLDSPTTTVLTTDPPETDNATLIGIVTTVTVLGGIIIASLLIGLVRRQRRQLRPVAPTRRPPANMMMTVGAAMPASYMQHHSYVPQKPENYSLYVDDDRYKRVFDLYMDGDQRSTLVLDRFQPLSIHRHFSG